MQYSFGLLLYIPDLSQNGEKGFVAYRSLWSKGLTIVLWIKHLLSGWERTAGGESQLFKNFFPSFVLLQSITQEGEQSAHHFMLSSKA